MIALLTFPQNLSQYSFSVIAAALILLMPSVGFTASVNSIFEDSSTGFTTIGLGDTNESEVFITADFGVSHDAIWWILTA